MQFILQTNRGLSRVRKSVIKKEKRYEKNIIKFYTVMWF